MCDGEYWTLNKSQSAYCTVSHSTPFADGPIFILLPAIACCFTLHPLCIGYIQHKDSFMEMQLLIFQTAVIVLTGFIWNFITSQSGASCCHGFILYWMLLVGHKHLQQASPNLSSCRCRRCPQPLPLIQTQLPAREWGRGPKSCL